MTMENELVELLGPPVSSTKYVHRWHVSEGFDVVYSRRSDHVVWMTWSLMVAPPPMGKIVSVGRGKNSNIPHQTVPSLCKGEHCLEVSATTNEEQRHLLAFVHDRISSGRR